MPKAIGITGNTFDVVERIQELRESLKALSARSLTDLSEEEQDVLFFDAEEFYALTGHDFAVEPTSPEVK